MRRVFVHRYKYSHDARRQQLRRAAKKGLVRVIDAGPDGWLYEVPEDYPVHRTRR